MAQPGALIRSRSADGRRRGPAAARADSQPALLHPSGLQPGTRVLGIDPGLHITGYGLVEVAAGGPRLCEAGVVRSSKRSALDRRLQEIFDGIEDVLAAFRPAVMALEELYSHYDRPRTAIWMAHARGVICLASARAQVPVVSYAATRIKKMLTGNGRAPKGQMQRAVSRQFALAHPPEPPDVADAVAVALCHVFVHRPGTIPP